MSTCTYAFLHGTNKNSHEKSLEFFYKHIYLATSMHLLAHRNIRSDGLVRPWLRVPGFGSDPSRLFRSNNIFRILSVISKPNAISFKQLTCRNNYDVSTDANRNLNDGLLFSYMLAERIPGPKAVSTMGENYAKPGIAVGTRNAKYDGHAHDCRAK